MSQTITPGRVCRVCGCTDDRACRGGCWWVEWDLCSACRERAYAAETPVARGPRPEGFVPASCLRCRRPVLVYSQCWPEPMVMDPVQRDKGKPQGYLFTHDCPCGDEDDDDFDPGDDW